MSARYDIVDLPEAAGAAAARFYERDRPAIAALPDATVTLVFAPAPYDHRGWRKAAIADLARAHAPRRINGVAGEGAAVGEALAYLAGAEAVTGQYLPLAGDGE